MIKAWLESNNLEHLVSTFESESISIDVLPELTDKNLIDLGVVLGDRIRLKRAIRKTNTQSETVERGVQLRHVTILFCDLVDSVQHSRFLDAEDYLRLMQNYQKTVGEIMVEYGGLVVRYHGDGVLVVFGYPNSHEDDPDRAILAGTSAVKAVESIYSPAGDNLNARVGIATGEVIVGRQLGVDISAQLSVAGSTTNFAARLQAFARPGGVIVSDATYRLANVSNEVEVINNIDLRGIEEPVTAYVIHSVTQTISSTKFLHSELNDSLAPMISRAEELDIIRRAWKCVTLGEGQLIYVTGDAGIGKTRLVHQFLTSVKTEIVIRFYCRQITTNTSLYPLIDVIKSQIELYGSKNYRHKLAQLLRLDVKTDSDAISVFEELISTEGANNFRSSSTLDKKIIFGALFLVLERRLAIKPLIIVVEDVHWADPTTLDFLSTAVAWLSKQKIFIIATGRSDETPDFANSSSVNTLKLTKLTRLESEELIRQITGGSDVAKQDINAIIDRCDGIPLYLEEVSRALIEGDSIDQVSDQSSSIPEALKDLLMARLDRLGHATKLAQIASVFGRQFTEENLYLVSGLGQSIVKEGLAKLVASRIAVSRMTDGHQLYEFNHALVRDAAYRSMLREEKILLHAAIAEKIFPIGKILDHEYERAARHYESAGDINNAVILWEAAGKRAHKQSANIEAERLFQHALNLSEKLSGRSSENLNEVRLALRLQLGAQLIACYGNGANAVADCFRKAQELCGETSPVRTKFNVFHGIQSCEMVSGDLTVAMEIGERLLVMAADAEDSQLAVRAHRAYGWTKAAMGDFDNARIHLNNVKTLYDPDRHSPGISGLVSDPLVLATCNLAFVECFSGSRQLATQLAEEAITFAEKINNRHGLAFSLGISTVIHQVLDQTDLCKRLSEVLLALSETYAFPYWKAWAKIMLAWTAVTDDEEKIDTNLADGLEQYRLTGSRMLLPYFYCIYAETLIRRELYAEAKLALEMAESETQFTKVAFYYPDYFRLVALLSEHINMETTPEQALEQAKELATSQNNHLLLSRID